MFREATEAGLIVGVVLAATEGVAGRDRRIACGFAAGVASASPIAAFAAALSDAFDSAGHEIFTAAPVVMLSWHILWMSHHAAAWRSNLETLGRPSGSGSGR